MYIRSFYGKVAAWLSFGFGLTGDTNFDQCYSPALNTDLVKHNVKRAV